MLSSVVVNDDGNKYSNRRGRDKEKVMLKKGGVQWIILGVVVIFLFAGIIFVNSIFTISVINRSRSEDHVRSEADNAVLQGKLLNKMQDLESHLVAEIQEQQSAEAHESEVIGKVSVLLDAHNLTSIQVFAKLIDTVQEVLTPLENSLLTLDLNKGVEQMQDAVALAKTSFKTQVTAYFEQLRNAAWPLKAGLEESLIKVVSEEEARGDEAEERLPDAHKELVEEKMESVRANEKFADELMDPDLDIPYETKVEQLNNIFTQIGTKMEDLRFMEANRELVGNRTMSDETVLKLEIMLEMYSVGWQFCAMEGQLCECDTEVIFGHGSYDDSIKEAFSGPIKSSAQVQCTAETFGAIPMNNIFQRNCKCKLDSSDAAKEEMKTEILEELLLMAEEGDIPSPPKDVKIKSYLKSLLETGQTLAGDGTLSKVDCTSISSCQCHSEDCEWPILDSTSMSCHGIVMADIEKGNIYVCTKFVGKDLVDFHQMQVSDFLKEEIDQMAALLTKKSVLDSNDESAISALYEELGSLIGTDKLPLSLFLDSEDKDETELFDALQNMSEEELDQLTEEEISTMFRDKDIDFLSDEADETKNKLKTQQTQQTQQNEEAMANLENGDQEEGLKSEKEFYAKHGKQGKGKGKGKSMALEEEAKIKSPQDIVVQSQWINSKIEALKRGQISFEEVNAELMEKYNTGEMDRALLDRLVRLLEFAKNREVQTPRRGKDVRDHLPHLSHEWAREEDPTGEQMLLHQQLQELGEQNVRVRGKHGQPVAMDQHRGENERPLRPFVQDQRQKPVVQNQVDQPVQDTVLNPQLQEQYVSYKRRQEEMRKKQDEVLRSQLEDKMRKGGVGFKRE